MDDPFHVPEDSRNEPDRILAAAIYLMTCHARNQCPRLACVIERHLAALARHADTGELVRDMARRLSSAWRVIQDHDERRAAESVHAARRVDPLLH